MVGDLMRYHFNKKWFKDIFANISIYLLTTYMRVFLLRFVRVGDPTAQLTDMYDTSPESPARGAVYRLPFNLQ